MTEDLQKKYKNKGRIQLKSVPLAEDAAHLLADYLDSLSIELVRQGVAEPYRIARDYEEILVQELQQRGTTSKLTYEVIQEVLDSYGSPADVVEQYIQDNQPQRFKYIQTKVPTEEVQEEDEVEDQFQSEPKTGFLRFGQVLIYAVFIGTISLLFQSLFMNDNQYNLIIAGLLVIVSFIDIITGRIWDTLINPRHYQTAMRIIKLELIIITVSNILLGESHDFTTVLIVLTGLIFFIGWIKRFTGLLDDYTTGLPKIEFWHSMAQLVIYTNMITLPGIIAMITYIELFPITASIPAIPYIEPVIYLSFVMFGLLEFITGIIDDTIIRIENYHRLRELNRFAISTLLIVTSAHVLQDNQYLNVLVIVGGIWIFMYGMGLLKERTNLLSDPSRKIKRYKPLARFVLPSYMLLIATYILSGVLLYVDLDNKIPLPTSNILPVFILGGISLLADFRRRYPLSLKKIGYTYLLIVVLFYLYTYPAPEKFLIFSNKTGFYASMKYWFIFCTVITILLVRFEIKKYFQVLRDYIGNQLKTYQDQIKLYQNQLKNYQE